MRADGRRLGRIIGQLDDIQALIDYYGAEEPLDEDTGLMNPLSEALTAAYHNLSGVIRDTQLAVDIINGKVK